MRLPLRVRISVRALIVLVLLVGGVLGWIVHGARVQRDAVAAIVHGGGKVLYDWEVKYVPDRLNGAVYQPNPSGKPWWPMWLVDRLGPDYFGDVRMVILGPKDPDTVMASVGRLGRVGFLLCDSDSALTDAGLAHIRGFTRLEWLVLNRGAGITGAGLENLKDLKGLVRLQFFSTTFTDADLIRLKGLTALRCLQLSSPRVTDAGLVHLRGLVRMRLLDLMYTQVTAAGLTHLHAMTRLEYLALNGTRVDDLARIRPLTGLEYLNVSRTPMTDAGLAGLEGLGELQSLDLEMTGVTDAGLEHLRGLKKLHSLRVRNSKVSNEAFAELQQVLPSLTTSRAPKQAAPARQRPEAN